LNSPARALSKQPAKSNDFAKVREFDRLSKAQTDRNVANGYAVGVPQSA
jgi:hypothetical protein